MCSDRGDGSWKCHFCLGILGSYRLVIWIWGFRILLPNDSNLFSSREFPCLTWHSTSVGLYPWRQWISDYKLPCFSNLQYSCFCRQIPALLGSPWLRCRNIYFLAFTCSSRFFSRACMGLQKAFLVSTYLDWSWNRPFDWNLCKQLGCLVRSRIHPKGQISSCIYRRSRIHWAWDFRSFLLHHTWFW